MLRFPGHTTNCTNTEQHVEGPGAAFKEKRQRDVLYGQVEGTKSSAETLVFVHRQETQQETKKLMDNTLPVSHNEAGAKHRKVFLSR